MLLAVCNINLDDWNGVRPCLPSCAASAEANRTM